MTMKTGPIIVLGGYGGTGQFVSRLLLKETTADIIIAGRSIRKAEECCARFRKEFPGRTIAPRYADASEYGSLVTAFRNTSLVLVASTTPRHVQKVAEAALTAGADYLDYHFDQSTVPTLEALAPRIEKEGRCFITQAGFHPGLPSAFVRHAARHFDRYRKAVIGMAMNARIEKAESVVELVDEIGSPSGEIFKEKMWRKVTYKDARKMDLGPHFGVRSCYPIKLAEMRRLPEMFGLEETGVYAAGFNWFVDYIAFPLAFLFFTIRKGLGRNFLAKVLVWGINTFSSSRQGVFLVLDAAGEKGGHPVTVRLIAEHTDAYEFTAIPVVACIRQYLDGVFANPGLWMMGHVVDPGRLMKDMERMGIKIHLQIADGGDR
jgi:saccharopine dehydrogenase (NAD+, L-lysine-forming)